MDYVLGFAFTADKNRVLLISKNRPAWQKGLLNGIGGKMVPGELSKYAMCREFFEETGIKSEPSDWRKFCLMHGADFNVHCFSMQDDRVLGYESCTDEPARLLPVNLCFRSPTTIPDLWWLIPAAMDSQRAGFEFVLNCRYFCGEPKLPSKINSNNGKV